MLQPELFKGAILFAPMLSLERASKHGLNYYLRWVPAALLFCKFTLGCQSEYCTEFTLLIMICCVGHWQPF